MKAAEKIQRNIDIGISREEVIEARGGEAIAFYWMPSHFADDEAVLFFDYNQGKLAAILLVKAGRHCRRASLSYALMSSSM